MKNKQSKIYTSIKNEKTYVLAWTHTVRRMMITHAVMVTGKC